MDLDPGTIGWLAVLGTAGAYEGLALLLGWRTLSRVVWDLTAKAPRVAVFVAFASGFLCGHLFG